MSKLAINGVFLLDKPLHMSSNTALQIVKRIFQAKKAGHTGSLDPLASGMLPICLGEATKFAGYLLDAHKTYLVTGKLGITTTTGDAEGDILTRASPIHYSESDLSKILAEFIGPQTQIPPMYSALKHQGKPLYTLARQGVIIERKPREITIFKIDLLKATQDEITLRVRCSKGTYIRTLIEDIGKRLGAGAHVTLLHREAVGDLPSKMYNLDELHAFPNQAALEETLLPMDMLLKDFPKIVLSGEETLALQQGRFVLKDCATVTGIVKLYGDEDRLIGLGQIDETGKIIPKRLLSV